MRYANSAIMYSRATERLHSAQAYQQNQYEHSQSHREQKWQEESQDIGKNCLKILKWLTWGGGTDIHPLHQLSEIYHLWDMFKRYGPLPFNLCVNQALKFLVGGSTSGGSNMQQMEQECQSVRTPSRNTLRHSGSNTGSCVPCEEVHTVIQLLWMKDISSLEFHYQSTKSIWWRRNGSAACQKMAE